MIFKKRAATSQRTDELAALTPSKPRLAFARDESSGGDVSPGQERRVLIVEDDFLIASDAQSALTEAGFEVVGVAASAEEALQIVADRPPALVVMDIRLSGRRDGIDLALELFQKHELRCIFATAHIDAEARRRAAPAQPLGWLPKPYTAPLLVDLVRRLWS